MYDPTAGVAGKLATLGGAVFRPQHPEASIDAVTASAVAVPMKAILMPFSSHREH
jgi:hypothetical protein